MRAPHLPVNATTPGPKSATTRPSSRRGRNLWLSGPVPSGLSVLLLGAVTSAGLAQPPNPQKQDARPKPLFAEAAPICPCADLMQVSIPNTTIESAAIDPTDGSCRVVAVVNHPPANDRVRVFVGLPVKDWNG